MKFASSLSYIMNSASVKLAELNEFISCPVCQGYLIDATTVNECLHTFCKSCIVNHIKSDHNECPKCNTVIHERRPLDYIVHDRNKQDIVYKLVPQLYISELNNRLASETRSIDSTKSKLAPSKKFLNVVLVQLSKRHHNNNNNNNNNTSPTPHTKEPKKSNPIYLRCPLTIKVYHIRKLLFVKYQLLADDKITIQHKGDIVSDEDQVSNLAQSLTFCLHYEISRLCTRIKKEEEEDDESTDVES